MDRETEFGSIAEEHFFRQWQESKHQCDRLRRDLDSATQDNKRLKEMIRIKNVRPAHEWVPPSGECSLTW